MKVVNNVSLVTNESSERRKSSNYRMKVVNALDWSFNKYVDWNNHKTYSIDAYQKWYWWKSYIFEWIIMTYNFGNALVFVTYEHHCLYAYVLNKRMEECATTV